MSRPKRATRAVLQDGDWIPGDSLQGGLGGVGVTASSYGPADVEISADASAANRRTPHRDRLSTGLLRGVLSYGEPKGILDQYTKVRKWSLENVKVKGMELRRWILVPGQTEREKIIPAGAERRPCQDTVPISISHSTNVGIMVDANFDRFQRNGDRFKDDGLDMNLLHMKKRQKLLHDAPVDEIVADADGCNEGDDVGDADCHENDEGSDLAGPGTDFEDEDGYAHVDDLQDAQSFMDDPLAFQGAGCDGGYDDDDDEEEESCGGIADFLHGDADDNDGSNVTAPLRKLQADSMKLGLTSVADTRMESASPQNESDVEDAHDAALIQYT